MKPDIALIKKVLELPTAPFHEEAVSLFVQNFCKKLRLRCQKDLYGNLKVVYKRAKGPPLFAMTAHMDHPGFEVIRGGTKAIVQLLGGVPDRYFKKAKIIVWQNGSSIKGKVLRIRNRKKRQYQIAATQIIKKGAFGTFDLPGVRIKKRMIYTKAADDMINVALLLNFLKGLVRKKMKTHIQLLFTRAEEVGLVGALGVAKKKWISKKTPIVVLEASNAKAGKVTIGNGPVLRVGDRVSTFSHAIDLWLQETAKGLKVQRALLSGGRCESTVYVEKGYETGCLALPLGNYHNIGPKNYAMEYVSLNDYKNMLEWLFCLAQSPPPKKMTNKRERELDKLFEKYSGRLKIKSKA